MGWLGGVSLIRNMLRDDVVAAGGDICGGAVDCWSPDGQ